MAKARRLLLVGGAGYVGSTMIGQLLQQGYFVRCFDALLYENADAITSYLYHPQFEFCFGDFTNDTDIQRALTDIDDVVILAGLVGDPITKKYPNESAQINDTGMARFIDALNGRDLERVLFVSTCSNYGLIKDDELADEDFELNPLSLYAKAKVSTEKKVLALKGQVDYSATVLRFSTAFGISPRMRFDLTVNEFTRELMVNKKLLVYDADTWRPYCHVQDFSRAIQLVLEAPQEKVAFEVFNVGGDVNNFTKRQIVEAIAERVPGAEISYKDHGGDPRNYRVNFNKIKTTLDFVPKYTVTDGIDELVKAVKNKIFFEIQERRNFHGNYEINYPQS